MQQGTAVGQKRTWQESKWEVSVDGKEHYENFEDHSVLTLSSYDETALDEVAQEEESLMMDLDGIEVAETTSPAKANKS
jgi:hypothetical protein